MRRFITVLKMRGSDHDKTLREYVIEKAGIHVKDSFKGIQGVFSGNVHRNVEQEEILKAFKDLSRG